KPQGHRRIPGMDRALAEIVDRCLEVDPDKRLRSARAVLEALEQRARQRHQRPFWAFGQVAALLLLLSVGSAVYTMTKSAIDNSEQSLTEQLLHNNRQQARFIADLLQERMEGRMKFLCYMAYGSSQSSELYQATARTDAHKLKHLLEQFLE